MTKETKNLDKTKDKQKKKKPHRFKKGQSGNPNGRPKGTTNFTTDFDAVVKEIAKEEKITRSEARRKLLKVAYQQAKVGEFNFYKDICDRYYGKPADKHDLRGKDGEPLGVLLYPVKNDNKAKDSLEAPAKASPSSDKG